MKNPEGDVLKSPATALTAITLGFTTLGLVWHFSEKAKAASEKKRFSISSDRWLDEGEQPTGRKILLLGKKYKSVLIVPTSDSIHTSYNENLIDLRVVKGPGTASVFVTPLKAGDDIVGVWQYDEENDDVPWMKLLPIEVREQL